MRKTNQLACINIRQFVEPITALRSLSACSGMLLMQSHILHTLDSRVFARVVKIGEAIRFR